MLELMYDAGLRPPKVINLRASDIYAEAGERHLKRPKGGHRNSSP